LFKPQRGSRVSGPLYGLKVASDALGRMAEKLERASSEPSTHVPTERTAAMPPGETSDVGIRMG